MKKLLLLIGLSLWMSGCSPQSAAELRSQHDQHTSFEISAPYETVYQRVYEKARVNFYGGALGSRYRVAHDLFTQRQTANVSLYVETHTRDNMLVTIDIHGISDERCRVDVYRVQDAFAEKLARQVPDWAASDWHPDSL